jgi:hypothetical protein
MSRLLPVFRIGEIPNYLVTEVWAGRQKNEGREKLLVLQGAEEIVIYSAKVN